MNTKLAILVAAGLCLCGRAAFAQPASPLPALNPPAAAPVEEPVDLAAKTPADRSAPERAPLALELELPAAIQFLARMANLNIHIDPSITFTNANVGPDGRPTVPMVSLRWDNVTAEEALEEVLDIQGLILLRNPKSKIARVTRKPAVAPLVTTVLQLKYANPTNVADLIKSTFSDTRSKVTPDARTGQLVLVSTEKEIEGITNLVVQLDAPTRQILIEAHLLETAKNPRSIKGIDWSGTLEGQNITFGNGRTRGTTTTQTPGAPISTTLPSGRNVSINPASSTRTELTTDLGLGGISLDTVRGFNPSTAFLNADGVRAVLSFLNSDADTEVVATPRQVTSDNQTATLAVTRAYPIFETTPGSAQTPPSAKITYTNLGTILKVTPRIAAWTNVVLKVIPEVSNIDSKDRQIINGDINEANVYAIRKMETEVVIPSGNTLVMGGLISDTSTKSYTKVPLLGDLPGIGMAFRRENKERRKSNLIIFVTPTIVQDHDFQPTSTDFLRSKPAARTDIEESAFDRGKPHEWKKKSK
jgi:type IV pilus assembly protein PilQ